MNKKKPTNWSLNLVVLMSVPSAHHTATKVIKESVSDGGQKRVWAIRVHDLLQKFMRCQAHNLPQSKTTSCVCRHKLWPVPEWDNDQVGQCWICVSVYQCNCGCKSLSLSVHLSDSAYVHRAAAGILLPLPPLIYHLAQSSSKNLHGTRFFVNLWYASLRSREFVQQQTCLCTGISRGDSRESSHTERTLHSSQAMK